MDTESEHRLKQTAPYPEVLAELVSRLTYRPGWAIKLADIDRGQGSEGLTLIITTRGYDSRHPENGENYRVNHYMTVPPAAFDKRSWRRWLFEQFLLVERHEAMEFFAIEGQRPYTPSHGFGQDAYLVRELYTEEDQRRSFRNELNPA